MSLTDLFVSEYGGLGDHVLLRLRAAPSPGYPTARSRGGEEPEVVRARCRRSPSAIPAAKIARCNSVLRRRCKAVSDTVPSSGSSKRRP
jgi:hypothetical protein